MAKTYRVRFGPDFPLVPLSKFSKHRLSKEQWENAWRLCGPSVERNMQRKANGQCLELWQVITSAYLEGLGHGCAATQQKEGT